MDQNENFSNGKRSSEWVSVSDLDNLENEKTQQTSKCIKLGSIIFTIAGILFLWCCLYKYDQEPMHAIEYRGYSNAIETLEDGDGLHSTAGDFPILD